MAQKKKDKDEKEETAPAATAATTNGGNSQFEFYRGIYHTALKYNDLLQATDAVYQIMAVAPEQPNWKDTLDFLYYNTGRFEQALRVGDEILATKDTAQSILEIVAISEQNLGMDKEALDTYEKLYKLSHSIYHQYKIATLQYALKRFGECAQNIQEILQSKDNTQKIAITDNNRQQQNVSLKAAVLNMNGVIALELNQNTQAKQSFEEALKSDPDFALAKANLDLVNKKLASTDKESKPAKSGNH
jgi:tetratricopeptide (TPR) repeat protein